VKKRELGIAYASSKIRPFPLAASPASYSCERTSPNQDSPKKVGRQNNTIAGAKKHYFNLQTFECFKQVNVYYMATQPECYYLNNKGTNAQ
jgi:hypothetical protein